MSWFKEELNIDFGDERLTKRAYRVLEILFSKPQLNLPQQSKGWTEMIGAYRFFRNKKVTEEKILSAHKEATCQRIAEQKKVLLLQDTSELDFSSKQKKIDGLGVLSSENRKGLYLHPLLATTPERLCLGVVGAEFLCRDEIGKNDENRDLLPIENKESYRWIKNYQLAAELAQKLPETQLIVIGDRESDIYELFVEREKTEGSKPDWLVRAYHDRALKEESEDEEDNKQVLRLSEKLLSTEALGVVKFNISSRKGEKSRKVEQQIFATQITLNPPERKKFLPAVNVYALLAQEINPPPNTKPLQWLLLTSLPITSHQASEVLQHYLCRWDIEIFFKVLKSGCTIEDLQLEHVDNLKPCLALYMIVAWRAMLLTMLGRECPDLPCDLIFEDFEWKTIYAVTTKQSPPQTPPSINQVVKLVASWGGYLGRKNDPPPGHKAIWIGLQRCRDFVIAFEVVKENKNLLAF